MKYLLFSFILLSNLISAQNSIELVKWTDEPCDSDYDPYLLINRITSISEDQGVTSVTINFKDNCCPEFVPSIEERGDTLFFFIWKENKGSCSCTCCFSMRYDLKNYDSKKSYTFFFQDREIKPSDDPYPIVEPTSELYNGLEINRKNKYGFKEGLWIEFYDDGSIKSESYYRDHTRQPRRYPLASKFYYENGQLAEYMRKDTIEYWFENGDLRYYEYTYSDGDTVFTEEMSMFTNKKLKRHILECAYKIKADHIEGQDFGDSTRVYETVYEIEYYDNGRIKLDLHINKDTSYRWFESGELERLEYRNGSKNYSKNGILESQSFTYQVDGSRTRFALILWFRTNSTILLQVKLIKYELFRSPKEYIWDFTIDGELYKYPTDWEGPYPWKQFPELNWIDEWMKD